MSIFSGIKRSYLIIACIGGILVCICCLLGAIILFYHPESKLSRNEQFYIAHGGGEIEGYQKTNSKEAVLNSIHNGMQYVELDLGMTSDSCLVALHNWRHYRLIAGCEEVNDLPLSKDEFLNRKIHSKFTPMTIDDIKEILNDYPNLRIVTDKISDPAIINNNFKDFKDRVIIECFSDKDYLELTELGYQCLRSRIAEPKILYFFKYKLLGAKQKSYATSIEAYEKRTKNIILAPPEVETALYSSKVKRTADSIFAEHPNIRFIYIDEVE